MSRYLRRGGWFEIENNKDITTSFENDQGQCNASDDDIDTNKENESDWITFHNRNSHKAKNFLSNEISTNLLCREIQVREKRKIIHIHFNRIRRRFFAEGNQWHS